MRLFAVAVSLWAATAPAAPAQDAAGRSLRRLSFNVHHCEGSDGQRGIERIARIIRDADPDHRPILTVARFPGANQSQPQ